MSVAIPTYNRAGLLRDCLRSLIAQDYPRDRSEIIVVDDGSTDSTAELAREFAAVRYLRQSHGWLNVARNAAVREALGEVIVFLDDDIIAPPSWLTKLANGVRAHPYGWCFGGAIRLRLEGLTPRHCERHPLGEGEFDLGDRPREVEFVWGGNMAVTRRAFEVAGLFDESLPWLPNEEFEWQHRLRVAGGTILYLPEPWVWHRRTVDDPRMRVGSLLLRHFDRGVGQASFFAAIKRPLRMRDAIWRLPRPLAHAVVRRCWWGVFEAAGQAGFLYGVARRRLARM
jgi:glycosyltransferase involved in cell wall biosynthesis